jgi:hypothetical protein
MKNGLKRILVCTLAAWILTGLPANAYTGLPEGLLIVGYDGQAWYPYISRFGTNDTGVTWRKITDIRDPTYLTWQRSTGLFLVKGNDGRLYRYGLDGGKPEHLVAADNNSYTQMRADPSGFVLVQLVAGKSRDTHIVSIGAGNRIKRLVQQQSAQFHPYRFGSMLYYAHVSCRSDCSPLIQEVWRKNLNTGRAEQLTLLNATSYLHSIDPEGRHGFVSSNRHGYYHIARLNLQSGEVAWLTDGQVTDSFPSIAADGSVYFIRRTDNGTQLMRLIVRLDGSGSDTLSTLHTIPLPEGVRKIRYLELNYQ